MDLAIVDIFVPTYEPDPNHLRAALDSILAQTEQRFRVYIHDDASNIDVLAIVAPYLENERFSFQRSHKRLGIGGNWNACLQFCRAPYIQYLFQDDIWDPTYLESALHILQKHDDVGFVAIEHRYVADGEVHTMKGYDELRAFKNEHLKTGHQNGREFLHWWMDRGLHPNVIGEPSFVMLNRWLVDEVGPFNETMPQFLDVEYWLRCIQKTNWWYISTELGSFRVHAKGASAENDRTGAGIYDRFHCLESLVHSLHGEDKYKAKKAFSRAIEHMVWKFLARVRQGKKVGKSSGKMKSICLRHPLLVTRGIYRCVRNYSTHKLRRLRKKLRK